MKHISLALSALLMTACATHESSEMGADDADKPQLKLAAVRSGSSTMRAADNIQTAAFDADELIRGYISFTDGGTPTNYDGILLTTMAADDHNVNPLHPERYMVGPSDRTATVSAYALYPSWLTKESTSFTVSADQREAGDATIEASNDTDQEKERGYKGSDLMWGTPDGNPVSAEVSPIEIKFSHKMAKVVVNAKSDGSVSGLMVTGVKIKNVLQTIGLNGETGALGATSGDAGDILMSNFGGCLLPPTQTIAQDVDFIEVTTNKGTAMFKLGSALTLVEGHQYTFTVDVGMQALKLQANNTILNWEDSGVEENVRPLGEGEFAIRSIPDDDGRVYNNTEHKPEFVVLTAEGSFDSNSTEYSANFDEPQYFGNVNAGQGIVVVKGKDGGTYEGKVGTQSFIINPRDINEVTASVTGDYTYNGALQTATVVASDNLGGEEFSLNATDHYDLSGNQQTDASETGHDLVLTGKGNYTGTKTIPFKIMKAEITADDLSFQTIEHSDPGNEALTFTKSQLSDSQKDVVVNFKGGTLTAESSALSSKISYGYTDCTSSANAEKQGTITVKRTSNNAFYGLVTVKLTPDGNHKTADGNPLTMTFHLAAATTLSTSNAVVGNVVARDASVFSSKNNSMEIPSDIFAYYNTTNVGVITASGYVVMLWNNQGDANSDGQCASWADSDNACSSANSSDSYGVLGYSWKAGNETEYTTCITGLWSSVNTTIVNAGGKSLGGLKYSSSTFTAGRRRIFQNGQWTKENIAVCYIRPIFTY